MLSFFMFLQKLHAYTDNGLLTKLSYKAAFLLLELRLLARIKLLQYH